MIKMENLFPSRRGTVPRTAVFVKMVLPSLRLPHLPCTAVRIVRTDQD